MYTSRYLVSRGAEEIRRNLQAEVARDRLAARAATGGQVSSARWSTAATVAIRSLRARIATQVVGYLQPEA